MTTIEELAREAGIDLQEHYANGPKIARAVSEPQLAKLIELVRAEVLREREHLTAELEQYKADAERYRWWTKTENDIPSRVFIEGKPSVDEFIDSAMKGQP